MASRSRAIKKKRASGKRPEVHVSSGNIFLDLGFAPEEAAYLLIKSNLMASVEKLIQARGMTQAEAAKLFGVTQPRISDLKRGKIDLFSIDMLVRMLGRAGVGVAVRTRVMNGGAI